MPLINHEQGSPAWLSYRQTRVMATDSGIILGSNPYKTRLKLWEQKLGLEPPDNANKYMKHGTKLEPEARRLACEKLEIKFEPIVYEHDEHYWMAASLDGFSECGDFILEIKCPYMRGLHDTHLMGIIPPYYEDQMQHQMEVMDAISNFYCTYFPENKENPIHITEIRSNRTRRNEIVEKGLKFYNQMCNFEAPVEWVLKVKA